mmetsp:Transcript_13707/g.27325  ORF Transcript_13707/g.27325 Transcript_13707/m.27325 type:complete len:288 (+) Transcript_13707:225-1088(+)
MSALLPPSSTLPPATTDHPSPFIDLTTYVSQDALDKLDICIIETLKNRLAIDVETSKFTAENMVHADALEFCDRDTSTWCVSDVFVPYSGNDDFRQCRGHRGDARTWRPNKNAFEIPGVMEFVRSLPFFTSTGKVALIFNKVGDEGVEHADHELDDLVSEFVWIRTKSSNKQFYVVDNETGEKCFVPSSGARVGWFDDHLRHNISPVTANEDGGGCWSLRIDGRFNEKFRKIIETEGFFGAQQVPQEGDEGRGLRGVLAAQQDGPTFLQRENEYISDEEEEEEEEIP